MSHKEKTLSERLAELANPTPQFVDPEDEYNEDTKARLESFDEQYEAKEKISKKTLKNKSSLRHKNVELLVVSDKKYAGKRVSRKDLEEENQDDSEESISDAEESDSEDAVNIKEFKKKMMKEVNSRTRKMPPTDYLESSEDGSSEMDEERENGSDLDSLEEEADVDEEEHDDEDDDDDEDDEEEVGSIDDDDDDENEGDVKRVSKNPHDSDINKGKAIQNQLSLWDHLLECRIKLHKGLHLTNQLPQAPSNFKLFTKATGENHFVTAGQGAQAAIKTLLDNCLELQDLLLKSNPQTKTLIQRKSNGAKEDSDDEIPSDTDEEVEEDEGQTPKRKKLKVEEYETEIGDRHETFRGFCHRTLNMWNEKTRLASGRTGTGSKSGFGAFDQSILKQIEGILADKQRLVNRTRIKRSTYRVLGCLPKSQDTVKISKEEETLKKNDATSIENKLIDYEEFDPEIYDDDDFYHQLLRELIEKRTGEAGSNQIALGRQWLEIQKLRSKAKRKVDSKASKGRRLRYEVHPKLVSFMAPFPETSWNDIAKNELFASLFGSGPPVS